MGWIHQHLVAKRCSPCSEFLMVQFPDLQADVSPGVLSNHVPA